ncbi:alpha/beta-hydrolase [Meira miltonrushii]|uniref:Prolyl endopeptidase n=1 Tax=Meira miltonrushii TaxID=1280837 RepID=A0A316VKF7_9BASI|nr:alpha/beta-hydrolase [Meira miltonrushii]PWN36813.1 alpha/beta-hydrolase [Meira miltonrushii]
MVKFATFALIFIIAIDFGFALCEGNSWNVKETPFPKVKRVNKTYSYRSARANGNVTIANPYAWLEKPYDSDDDVKQFTIDQQKLTEQYMNKCTNAKSITQSIRNAFDYDDYFDWTYYDTAKEPFYVFSLQRIDENRKTYYIASAKQVEAAKKTNFATPPGHPFFKEDGLSVNGTASLSTFVVSNNGYLIAYLVVEDESDVGTWYVRKTSSPLVNPKTKPPGGEGRLPDTILLGDGALIWKPDDSGFFYTQVSDPKAGTNKDIGSVVRYHQMGTPYEKDITIVHPDSDESNNYSFDLSDNGDWLVVMASGGDGNTRAYASLLKGQTLSDKMKWISIVPTSNYAVSSVAIVDRDWYVQTDHDALNGKVAKYTLDWNSITLVDVIPSRAHTKLIFSIIFASNKVLLFYIEKGKYTIYLHELKTGRKIQQVLPNETYTLKQAYYASAKSTHIVMSLWGATSPKKVLEVDFDGSRATDKMLLIKSIKGTNAQDYITESLEAISRDGTKVPYYIVYHKETQRNGENPTLLHFYGSYGRIENLFYYPPHFSWLHSYRGVLVYAGPRGGSDNGEEWHEAGERLKKQNTFDDIIAVAQDLIKRKIAATGEIIADGISAGGLAAAVVARQAPANTFGAILADVAVLDYFLLARTRAGPFQVEDFGDPYNATDFDVIRSWSPLQNIDPIKQKVFPAILVTPADSDIRVVPAHSFKCIAQMQFSYPTSPNPLLMHLQKDAGHNVIDANQDTAIAKYFHQQCFVQLALGLTKKD